MSKQDHRKMTDIRNLKYPISNRKVWTRLAVLGLAVLGVAGCDEKTQFEVMSMRRQPRYNTQATAPFFPDNTASRPRVEFTMTAFEPISTEIKRPKVDLAFMKRGQERYNAYCSMCHGLDGFGEGVVVQRGFPAPPTFHSDRLRNMKDEQIERVITQGLGKMPPYRDQVPLDDRWAIVSYIRALQKSQTGTEGDVPAKELAELKDPKKPAVNNPPMLPEGAHQ